MKKNWYPLDNAAKIYPPTSNRRRGGMFSLSARMTEEVVPEILSEAVNVLLERFPIFKVKLKRGWFWYYLEENNRPFIVEKEEPYFLRYIGEVKNNDYLFRVMYRGDKINVSFYHSLCDGTGGLNFFKALLAEYLKLKGHDIKTEGIIINDNSPHTNSECEDTFLKAYHKPKEKVKKESNAFKTDGTDFDSDGCGVVLGQVKISKLKEVCKKYNATITEFLCALYVQCVYTEFIKNKKVKNKNVKMLIPVNMRKVYSSETMRNFALFARAGYDWKEEISFEELIALCQQQLKEGLQKEKLDAIIYSNVKIEKNVILKLMPLFIKDLAMRIAYTKVGDNLHTANLSNLGCVRLPESIEKHVSNISFALGPSYSCKTHLALLGYKDTLNMCFTRLFVETKIERAFFRRLSALGVDVTVSSNYWEEKL